MVAARTTNDDTTTARLRKRLRAGTAIRERRIDATGIDTMVLECGEGAPLILFHGPGEFAEAWVDVMPLLGATHHVVAPDLPGHGVSGVGPVRVLEWLEAVIARTCATPPVLVGHVVGGSIAMRFALAHEQATSRLVLVDTLGLSRFQPAPPMGEALHRFFGDPTAASYEGLMQYCSYDVDALRHRLGDRWQLVAEYAINRAVSPHVIPSADALLEEFGVEIPRSELARITVPADLVWGRHDLATPLRVAEGASRALGWPLYVVEDAADDPALDQPEAFVATLLTAIGHGDRR